MYIETKLLARTIVVSLLFLLFPATLLAQGKDFTLQLVVTEAGTKEPVVMGIVELLPSGVVATTDGEGRAVLTNVPRGRYTLRVRYVGMETLERQVMVDKDLKMPLQLVPTSLALKEVTVTARQRENGASTASVVGRQAIDHLQATSLADVMQLIPGQLMGNHDLTQQSN